MDIPFPIIEMPPWATTRDDAQSAMSEVVILSMFLDLLCAS